MGLLSKLFSSNKSVDTAVNGVVNGIDALFFTDEEKSRASMEGLKLQIEMAKALGPSNIARRVIAISVTGLWCFHVLLATGLQLAGFEDQAAFIFLVVKNTLNIPFVVVISFYFAKRMIPGLK